MAGSFPAAATFWSVYEAAKHRLVPLTAGTNWAFLAYAGAAASADIAVCAVRNPFEVVKQQMQAGLHTNTREAVRTILRVDGWRGLYAGYLSTVLREVPFDAIEFALYEHMKEAWRSSGDSGAGAPGATPGGIKKDLVLWQNALLGSIAGGTAAAVTTPLDVIKTRMMTQTKTQASDRYSGWGDAAKRILREEGGGALFSGIRPRVLWISIGGAIFIGSFEELKRRMQGSSGDGTLQAEIR